MGPATTTGATRFRIGIIPEDHLPQTQGSDTSRAPIYRPAKQFRSPSVVEIVGRNVLKLLPIA